MATVIANTKDGVLVEMIKADLAKISDSQASNIGDVFNIAPIYNRMTEIEAAQLKLKTLSNHLKTYADNIDTMANSKEITDVKG